MPHVVGGGGLHAALPDVSIDQHHAQAHAAAHLPAGADATDLNIHRMHFELYSAVITNAVFVGSGAQAALAAGRGTQFTTGATNPSSCSGRVQSAGSGTVNSLISRVRRAELDLVMADVYANSNSYALITDEATDILPSLTARHLGIKNLVGVVTFTTADGTTEQTTDISAFVVAGAETIFVITFDGVTARCFVNGTLRATHVTNVPAAGSMANLKLFINNNASANSRALTFYSADVLMAGS